MNQSEFENVKYSVSNDGKSWKTFEEKVNLCSFEEIIAHHTKNIELNPESVIFYIMRGDIYLSVKNYDEAMNDFNKLIELEPENASAYSTRGRCYLKMKRYDESINDYTKAIELNSKDTSSYDSRGRCYYAIKKYKEAIEDFTKFIELSLPTITMCLHSLNDYKETVIPNPNMAFYYLYIGLSYFEMKNYDQWLYNFDKAFEFNPRKAGYFYMERGKCYLTLQNHTEALNDFNKAVELEFEKAVHYAWRGTCLLRLENYAEALDDFNRAIELEPDSAESYIDRGVCYLFLARFEEALNDYNKAIELNPEDDWFYAMRGHCYSILKKYAEALDDLNKAVKKSVSEYAGYSSMLRGLCYSMMEKYAEALDDFNRAIELGSGYLKDVETYPHQNFLSYYLRADCHLSMQNYDAALNDFNEIIRIFPENSLFHYCRGNCYSKMQKYDEALSDLNKAIEFKPENLLAYLSRSFCHYNMKEEEISLADLHSFKKEYEKKPKLLYSSLIEDMASLIPPSSSEGKYAENIMHSVLKGETIAHGYAMGLGEISIDSDISFLVRTMDILLDLKKLEFYNEDYLELANILDNPNFEESKFSKGVRNLIYQLSCYYPKFKGSLSEILKRDGHELFVIRFKLSILTDICDKFNREVSSFSENEKVENRERIFNQQGTFFFLYANINKALQEKNVELAEKKEREKAQAEIKHEREIAQTKIDERNKVIADLSHSIKNLVNTIIHPLKNLKKEKDARPLVIDEALRGANLIREIVNAMNLSFEGSVEDFYYDARNGSRTDMQSVFVESLIYSVGNMFDGKYFPNFQVEYFTSEDILDKAESEWAYISQNKDLQEMTDFLREYFFEADFSFDGAADYAMGNENGSAIKFLILFQELILNAVKYSAFVSREDRRLQIQFTDTSKQIAVRIENRYNEKINVSTSGIGHVIVENFCKLMETEPVVSKKNGIYAVEVRFVNFWEEESK